MKEDHQTTLGKWFWGKGGEVLKVYQLHKDASFHLIQMKFHVQNASLLFIVANEMQNYIWKEEPHHTRGSSGVGQIFVNGKMPKAFNSLGVTYCVPIHLFGSLSSAKLIRKFHAKLDVLFWYARILIFFLQFPWKCVKLSSPEVFPRPTPLK